MECDIISKSNVQDQEIFLIIVMFMTVTAPQLDADFFSVTYPVVLLTYPIKRNVRGRGLLGLQFNALAFVGILEAAGHIASEKEKQIIVNIHSQFLYSPEFHPREGHHSCLLWFFPPQLPESRNPA